MSRLEELPDRLTEIEAGDIVEFHNKEYLVKGIVLDSNKDPQEWRVLTEDGTISESDIELIHKRDRSGY